MLEGSSEMRVTSTLAWLLAIAACGQGLSPRPAIPVACTADRIGRVTVTGATRHDVPALAVLEGTLDDPDRIERVRQLAVEGLRARGHARATVAVTRAEGCGVDLVATVDLGLRYQIERITFDTTDGLAPSTRLAVLEDALGTVNTIGGAFVEDRLRRALPELRRRYEDAGWIEATIGEPAATLSPDGKVAITIPIEVGRRFKLGTVRAVGGGEVNRDVVDALGLRAGAYYDKTLLRAGIERARRKVDRWIQVRVEVAHERGEIDVEAIVEGDR